MAENLEKVFVYTNRAALSPEKIVAKGHRLKEHCEANGYLQSGSLSISEPMSRCGSELPWIIDYCRNRGISKILVDNIRDIGKTSAEVQSTIQMLCSQGFQIEVADCGLTFTGQSDLVEPDENQGVMMGGM